MPIDLNTASYDEVRAWTQEQLAAGVSRQELRRLASAQDRQDGNWSAVDGIRHVTG